MILLGIAVAVTASDDGVASPTASPGLKQGETIDTPQKKSSFILVTGDLIHLTVALSAFLFVEIPMFLVLNFAQSYPDVTVIIVLVLVTVTIKAECAAAYRKRAKMATPVRQVYPFSIPAEPFHATSNNVNARKRNLYI